VPSHSSKYLGEAVVCGDTTIRVRGSRVEATVGGYRLTIAGGQLFVEHDSHRPWFDPRPKVNPAIIRIGERSALEKLDTDQPKGLN
jgi:hypothetical protein